jgi:RNA polymerase sigma-70 factor (ECF subfamily)
MRFQNWYEERNLIVEAVELLLILESLPEEDELEAAAQKAKENPSAIEPLLKLLQPVIEKSVAYKLRGGRDNAIFSDLVQDVLLAVWRNLMGQLGSPVRGPIRPWLGSVIHRKMIDALTAAGRRPEQQSGLYPDEAGWEDESPETAERDELMMQAIQRLRDIDREILTLHYFKGLKNKEIAERLGISVDTSKRRMHDARRRLRKELEAVGVSEY